VLGMAFDARVEVLTEFVSDPDDPKATAKSCFTAAIVYACFLGFCGCQVLLNRRKDQSKIR
jgi:ribonuclease kappa